MQTKKAIKAVINTSTERRGEIRRKKVASFSLSLKCVKQNPLVLSGRRKFKSR